MRLLRRNPERTVSIPNIPFSSAQTGLDGTVTHPVTQDGFWTVKELARYLGISKRWIHKRTRRNEIPCHRLGTALRFDPKEVHVWMIQRRGSATVGRGAV